MKSMATRANELSLPKEHARHRWPRLFPASLFWRVFFVNAALVTTAVVLLAVTPLTVSNPVTTKQALYLSLGLVILLASNLALLRVSLRPLQRLIQLMHRIDLLQPGDRLESPVRAS